MCYLGSILTILTQLSQNLDLIIYENLRGLMATTTTCHLRMNEVRVFSYIPLYSIILYVNCFRENDKSNPNFDHWRSGKIKSNGIFGSYMKEFLDPPLPPTNFYFYKMSSLSLWCHCDVIVIVMCFGSNLLSLYLKFCFPHSSALIFFKIKSFKI